MGRSSLDYIFLNLTPLPLLWGLVQPGLTAGRWQAGRRNTKLAVGRNIQLVTSFNRGTASLQPYQWFFHVKPIGRLIFKAQNFLEAIQFQINVLNDIHTSLHTYLYLNTLRGVLLHNDLLVCKYLITHINAMHLSSRVANTSYLLSTSYMCNLYY